jgi:protein transport protein SEC61 subunit gamma-like protein
MAKIFSQLGTFIAKCKRVWMVLKKPTKDEFTKVAKVSAVGILIIGFLGFIISLVMSIFLQ